MTDKELIVKLWDIRKLCYEVAKELESREKRE